MDNKKITIAIGSLSNGGAERVVSVWAEQLVECGYDVSLLLFVRGEEEYYISSKVKINSITDTSENYALMSPLSRYKRMRNIIKNEDPDYIISFLPNMQLWIMQLIHTSMKEKQF